MTISTTVKTIQDIMRKDVGVDGDAPRIGQLVWMLFLKIFDDKESEWELRGARYRSPIPERFRGRNWAADPEGMTGHELLEFCNNELFPQLKELSLGGNGRLGGFVVRSVFEDAYGPKERVDVIVTNPPFGGMEEDGIESNFPKTFQTRETADLCLLLIMHVLKPGGRAAIALPDGTLFGKGVKTRIEERLLDKCNLHNVVRLAPISFLGYTLGASNATIQGRIRTT